MSTAQSEEARREKGEAKTEADATAQSLAKGEGSTQGGERAKALVLVN